MRAKWRIQRDRIDRIASKVVRSEGKCLACGYMTEFQKVWACSERMECAHIISRGHLKIRHHPSNLTCLCNIHHRYFTKRPAEWEAFIEEKFPGRLDWLLKLRMDKDWEGMDYWENHWKLELKRIEDGL